MARAKQHRQMGSQAGLSLLELTASIALICIFFAVLLNRLNYYQEAAEKANMEYTANILKLALQVRIGRAMAENQQLDFAQIAVENPVTWVDSPLPNYHGEFSADPPELSTSGGWHFDRSRAELVYTPVFHRHLAGPSGDLSRVRWRVKTLVPDGSGPVDVTVLGLQLVPAQPYRWF